MNTNADVFKELKEIAGGDNVKYQEADLEYLSRTALPGHKIPQFIVYPETTEQIQAIMRLANATKLPVWYVSKGFNWGYGSASACYEGGITLVLEKMNKIHHVDEELGYAVIEPGVTYKQLNEYLKVKKSRLWSDCAGSTVNASVMGNALDRGRGLTPYSDHFGALCGMEVVLPTGEKLITGGGPDSTESFQSWNIYKWGVGPYVEGLFSQSNFGIVAKAGIWLMPAPEHFNFFVFEYTAGKQKFPEFLRVLRELLFQGVINSKPHLANAFAMLCIVSQYPKELLNEGETCLTEEGLTKWKKMHGIEDWTFGCALYGTKSEVRVKRSIVNKKLSKYGSLNFVHGFEYDSLKTRMLMPLARLVLKLKGKSQATIEGLADAINLYKGIPSDYFVKQVYMKSHSEKPKGAFNPAYDGCGFIWTGPVVPFKPESLSSLMVPVTREYKKYGFDVFVELIIESPRGLITLFGIFYDKNSESETENATALYHSIQTIAHGLGFPPYRATILSMPTMFDNNPPLKLALGKIKHALDPNNVLAPDKYGCSSVKG